MEDSLRAVIQQLPEVAQLKLGTLSLSNLETVLAQPNLRALDLKDNKIAAIPPILFQSFRNVKVLDLRKNLLEELPPAISCMSNLEDLLLDQNRLREFPMEISDLGQLKSISASQNSLKTLPPSIGEIKHLRSLSLGDNQICEIPPEIGSCKELQTLYLHHNHFTRLPTTLGKLENLSEMALEWFRYTTPPLPRVIKGPEWKRIIDKMVSLCKEKNAKHEPTVSCIEVLAEFSQKSFDPNAIDSKRRTRLHVACLEGHVGVAVSLAESSAKCDSLDCEGYSPLLVAVREEHPDIATALVRVGVDVNRGGGLFGSPLHVATVNFDPHMVLLLINGKADVNQTDADGNTPLHVLMSVFDKGGKRAGAIGQILLRHGADCNMMNSDKWAPLHLAARRGQLRGICFVLNHVDSVDPACLKGTCGHQITGRKAKSTRVRTCPRTFDLNLRGGSHLWTPLHLAGHACHVPVVQVLIEAGANVFLRNIDSRTARHVSRGNLAISKLLRKAEDEWLWYRIHGDTDLQGMVPAESENDPLWLLSEGNRQSDGANRASGAASENSRKGGLGVDEDDDDAVLKELDKTQSTGTFGPAPKPKPKPSGGKTQRIVNKCREAQVNRAELLQLQAANFATPCESLPDFIALFEKASQPGSQHRLPLLLSKTWAKEMLMRLIQDDVARDVLLRPNVVCNEDFLRLLVCNLPRDLLHNLASFRTSEQETILHVICKSGNSRAHPPTASCADILSYFLSVCVPEGFDLEVKDLRGQTPLHLAVQTGDLGLVQVLLEVGADPNAQEETTGWTPLHFAVAKGHYTLILQLLHHDATNVNQVDKFDWPPFLEACSRLDARAVSLLVNGGANLGFRNQHQFDILKAVDTSKKDLAAKRWMSCLVVSNGFRFEESQVQLNAEDRATLERERTFFLSRSVPSSNPPFYVPDHLAPRCNSCKLLFTVTVRRYHCRSCGLVLCGNCFKWQNTSLVTLDERLRSRQQVAKNPAPLPSTTDQGPLNERRLTAAVEMSMRDRAAISQTLFHPTSGGAQEASEGGLFAGQNRPVVPSSTAVAHADTSLASPRSDDSEDPPLAEELPAVGVPSSIVSPAFIGGGGPGHLSTIADGRTMPQRRAMQGGLSRERGSFDSKIPASRMIRLCSSCTPFFEVGLGETFTMLQRRGA